MSDVKFKIASRGHVRARLTKLCESVAIQIDSLDETGIQSSLTKLKKLETELSTLDAEISVLIFTEQGDGVNFATEINTADTYSDKLSTTQALLQSKLSGSRVEERPELPRITNIRPNKLKLPELPLPRFGNAKGESLLPFLVKFESIIDAYGLTSYAKFIFLKGQLYDDPLTVVKSLGLADQSYEAATDLLKKAFASDVTQKFDVLVRLRDLNCTNKPYEFASEMRIVKDLLVSLEIDIDTVLQFFVWNGLTSELQTQLITITNNNKPSYEEIENNIFKAIDRAKEIKSKHGRKTSTESSSLSSMAAKVKYNPSNAAKFTPFCSLCSEKGGQRVSSHNTRECQVYKSPQEKKNRLESLKSCSLCGYANHCTSDCKHKFKTNCQNCNGLHMTFLCCNQSVDSVATDSPSKDVKPKDSKAKNVAAKSGVLSNVTMQTHVGNEAIIPTFTCQIESNTVRVMKDSGCQTNFIEEELASKLDLPVTNESLTVTVNGFNIPQQYNTKEVLVKLKLKNSTHEVRAIVVPGINIELKIRGLSQIVQVLRTKGYILADEKLSNTESLKGINFILGTNDSHVLTETHIKFGNPIPSVYSLTEEGIMLVGNSERIIGNLQYLKHANAGKDNKNQIIKLSSLKPVTDKYEDIPTEVNSVNVSFVALKDGVIDEISLENAAKEILDSTCIEVLSYDRTYDEQDTEINQNIITTVVENTTRQEDGRLIMPLAWKTNAASLAENFQLAKKVLKSNQNKLLKNEEKLHMMDKVFQEQENLGIIERITDEKSFKEENPHHSYIAHMGVFKLNRETTKCRIVYLSNLCQKSQNGISMSHNQVMHAGPNLNQKITTALLLLRFDKSLLCFDLKKAFLQISLTEEDSAKLLILWYRNVSKNDFSLATFRCRRLPFGLRCSPALLMLALYRMLVTDAVDDPPPLRSLKSLMYALTYVDNGAVTGTPEEIKNAYENLSAIFSPYKFEVQQIGTNDDELQHRIDTEHNQETEKTINLLGLNWDRETDKLSTKPLNLDPSANTKRSVLSSVAKQYDIYGYHAPLLVRAKIYLHSLQCDKNLTWDEELSTALLKEWKLICKQANSSPVITIDRYIGPRSGRFALIAFTDASKKMYGSSLYLQDLDSGSKSFVIGKNRTVNSQLETKSIPTLELQAVTLGVELTIDLINELSGDRCLHPICIVEAKLYTDSLINLHWLNSYSHKHDKMQKMSVFVHNRLEYIVKKCTEFPITFGFTSTNVNPADCLTKPCSHKQLLKSTYFTGAPINDSTEQTEGGDFQVKIPASLEERQVASTIASVAKTTTIEQLVPVEKFSSFRKLVRVTVLVLKYVDLLKQKVQNKNNTKFKDFKMSSAIELFQRANKLILQREQRNKFRDVCDYLESNTKLVKDLPPIVSKLNVFLANDGLLRVKGKFDRWSTNPKFAFPILLDKNSDLTTMIIREAHETLAHSGCYAMLAHLRKIFWIQSPFSTVKRILKTCITCKRFNNRTVKLTQNSYRDFRSNPPSEPFKFIFLDYIGPLQIKIENKPKKVWLLAITCLWSRYVNLQICSDLTVVSFLRALQIHTYKHGLPSQIHSDLGSQIVAGAKIITNHLNTVESKSYLAEHGISSVKFEQYSKGNSALGSLIEICVKFTKRLIHGSIRKTILSYDDFSYVIAKTIYLINQRPIAFLTGLRDENSPEIPSPITPELLVTGREVVTTNLIPALNECNEDPDWNPTEPDKLKTEFKRLQNVRSRLIDVYNEEFVSQLAQQATNLRDRYKPVNHIQLKIGDLILLKENYTKASDYPLAVVQKITTNDIGEVTDVTAKKGGTGETVKRHVSSVVPFMEVQETVPENCNTELSGSSSSNARPKRKAKLKALAKIRTNE